MKKFIVIALALTVGVVANAQNRRPGPDSRPSSPVDDLRRLNNRVSEMVERNADRLSPREMRDVTMNLESIRDILRGYNPVPAPMPAPSINYCVSSCTDINGNPDLRYARGASAEFEVEARQKATEATMKAFKCNLGTTILACEKQSGIRHDAIAACTDINGNSDLRYSRLGTGNGVEQARQAAREATQDKFKCNLGVSAKDAAMADGRHYCSAACTDINGNTDTRYSKGSAGASTIEAKALAIGLTMDAHSCNLGVKITACSSQ